MQGAAPPGAPTGLSAKDHDNGSSAGYNGAIHVDFTVPQPNSAQLSRVEYGLNATSVSGSWNAPGAPGSSVEEAIPGLSNGTSYVVYVRGCNDAGLCGPWASPSNQVMPYGPPAAPNVTASVNGTSIAYSWGGGGGNGRPVSTYHVCFDGACMRHGRRQHHQVLRLRRDPQHHGLRRRQRRPAEHDVQRLRCHRGCAADPAGRVGQ